MFWVVMVVGERERENKRGRGEVEKGEVRVVRASSIEAFPPLSSLARFWVRRLFQVHARAQENQNSTIYSPPERVVAPAAQLPEPHAAEQRGNRQRPVQEERRREEGREVEERVEARPASLPA